VRADHCYRLPPSMSFNEAASLSLVYDTAWFALRERARLETGETVLVLGASGGVGRAAWSMKVRFAVDSPLEGDGFEPSVPPQKDVGCRFAHDSALEQAGFEL
jgi:hypothetical protein